MTEKLFDLRKAAMDEVRKAVSEVAEADICRTCYICRKEFPVDNVWEKATICPDCLDNIRKVLGVTV